MCVCTEKKKKKVYKREIKKKQNDSDVTQTKTFYLIADQFLRILKKFSNTKLILYLVKKVNRDPLLTKEWKIKTYSRKRST
jgi:hypothetical protein